VRVSLSNEPIPSLCFCSPGSLLFFIVLSIVHNTSVVLLEKSETFFQHSPSTPARPAFAEFENERLDLLPVRCTLSLAMRWRSPVPYFSVGDYLAVAPSNVRRFSTNICQNSLFLTPPRQSPPLVWPPWRPFSHREVGDLLFFPLVSFLFFPLCEGDEFEGHGQARALHP